MGAGLSSSLQNYVLRGWEAECHAPQDVENAARLLARFAFTLAEVHPPAHRANERIAQSKSQAKVTPWTEAESSAGGASGSAGPRHKRPSWLEPSLLHVLLISSRPQLTSVVLDGLRAASPLASVVADTLERDGGAFAAAKRAGFDGYAFVDAELRVLRLWTVSEEALLANDAAGETRSPGSTGGAARLLFFDISLWLVDEAGSVEQALPLSSSASAPADDAAKPAAAASTCTELDRGSLTQDLEEARAAKQAAIKMEDFERAQLWKAREKELEAKLHAAETLQASEVTGGKTGGTAREGEAEEQRLQQALAEARAAKQAAVEAEEFKDARHWKDKEVELEAALSALKARAFWDTAARDAAADAAAPPRMSHWQGPVRELSGSGRPPVLIVGLPSVPRELRCEAMRAGLPPNRVWALPRPSPSRPGLGGEPGFWNVVQEALKLVKANRDFPSEIPSVHLGSDVKLGASVRLRHLEEAPQQEFNGRCGTVVGSSGVHFLVRLWDGEIVWAVREQLTVLSFKLGASSPVQLNNMELMRVRLRDLKSKPELNGCEGETEDTAVKGRYTVSLAGGGSIAVKAENIEVIEPASRELQGCVGLVDARDPVETRYKVLLVKSNDRTEERSHVRLRDLRAKPELNGQEATIESFNPRTERFTLRLGGGGGEIAIKRQNFDFLQPVRIEATALSLRPQCVDYFLDPDDEDMLFEK